MIKIFEIPVCIRFLSLGEEEEYNGNNKSVELAMIDGKGVFVNYNREEDLFNIKEKPSVKRSFIFVPAQNYAEALADVFARCVGINFGGSRPSTKAVWIDKAIAIIEYPFCFMLYKTNGNFLCGEPMPHGILDLEPCFVQDFELKKDCPIFLSRIKVLLNYWAEAKKIKKIIFQGERYDFLKIRYEFDSPKIELKNIPIKGLFP